MSDTNIQVNFIHICDNAFLSKDNRLNVIGVFDRLFVAKFPYRHPKFTVVLNVTIEEGTYPFEIRLMQEGEESPKLVMNGEVKAKKSESFNLISDFAGIAFEQEGEYTVEIWNKDEKLTSQAFRVELPPQKKKEK